MSLPRLAVYASHSALQIAQGATKEGLSVTLFGPARALNFYRRFPSLKAELVECYGKECLDVLDERTHVLIPHGSLVEYVGMLKNMLRKYGYRATVLPIVGKGEERNIGGQTTKTTKTRFRLQIVAREDVKRFVSTCGQHIHPFKETRRYFLTNILQHKIEWSNANLLKEE